MIPVKTLPVVEEEGMEESSLEEVDSIMIYLTFYNTFATSPAYPHPAQQ
jgi:hypothetical protein